MRNHPHQVARSSSRRLGILLTGSLVGLLGFAPTASAQTPNFGPNVTIFTPAMSSSSIQSQLQAFANEAEFSTNRHAILFAPGTYNVSSIVGFYESIAGLGQSPNSVVLNGSLTVNQTDGGGNVTTNFWRSEENLAMNPAGNQLQWAVAQGAAFRRMQINGNMELANTYCGYASGGFISDSQITGQINSCSQQQWYTRDSKIGSWASSVWNMVFSGTQGAPAHSFPKPPYTTLATTPVSREKPFLYVDNAGAYNVFVPTVKNNTSGTTWGGGGLGTGYSVSINTFFIAQPSTTVAQINTALASGKNLLLTPGIYPYSAPINVTNANTIVLGLGYATLVPQAGTAALTVADVDGVQLASLLIDAGPVNSPVLLQVGNAGGTRVGHQSNPTSLSDIFFRIGGATAGKATTSLEVDSNNVILDNLWAWRADHGNGIGWTVNTADHGVVVNGDNVTALGLAVEHYQQNQVLWNGNAGETIFYQSELPYDVPSQAAYMNGSSNGYSAYAVTANVTSHRGIGMGVYSFFNQGVNIVEDSAITVPNVTGITITDAVSVKLNGSGSITHVVNDQGPAATVSGTPEYLVSYTGSGTPPTCTTVPSVPGAPSATATSSSQINLTYTVSTSSCTGITYRIFRSTTSGFTPSATNQIASGQTGTSYADTGLTASTAYFYKVESTDAAGSSAPSAQAAATTLAGGCTTNCSVAIALNSGGPATGSFAADSHFTGGGTSATGNNIATAGVVNAAPAAVYQTDRLGTFSYSLPGFVKGSTHTVRLHFAEAYFTAIGKRVFNVAINGTTVLANFDIFAAAGPNKALVEQFTATADTSGNLVISFSNGTADQPEVSGIEAQ